MKKKNICALSIVSLILVFFLVIAFTGLPIVGTKYYVASINEAVKTSRTIGNNIVASYEIPATEEGEQDNTEALNKAADAFKSRLSKIGQTDNKVYVADNKLFVEVSDYMNADIALSLLGSIGKIEITDPNGEVVITEAEIKGAVPFKATDTDVYYTEMQLTAEGRQKFSDASAEFAGNSLNLYLDDQLVSSPTVSERMDSENIYLPVAASIETSQVLSNAIAMFMTTEELESELSLVEVSDPQTSSLALPVRIALIAIVALIAVFLFVKFGKTSIGTVLTLGIFYLATLYIIGASEMFVTLYGILGIILGVALFTYIVYIRQNALKAELKAGRSFAGAFKNCVKTTRNNTLIAAGILLAVVILCSVVKVSCLNELASTMLVSVLCGYVAGTIVNNALTQAAFKAFN